MLLVVDANILFKALIGRGSMLKLFFLENLIISSPKVLFEEILKHEKEIANKGMVSVPELKGALLNIKDRIKLIPLEDISAESKEKAKSLAPHKKDEAYFAVALESKAAIWSDEKAFKKQSSVKVYNTSELMDLFKSGKFA